MSTRTSTRPSTSSRARRRSIAGTRCSASPRAASGPRPGGSHTGIGGTPAPPCAAWCCRPGTSSSPPPPAATPPRHVSCPRRESRTWTAPPPPANASGSKSSARPPRHRAHRTSRHGCVFTPRPSDDLAPTESAWPGPRTLDRSAAALSSPWVRLPPVPRTSPQIVLPTNAMACANAARNLLSSPSRTGSVTSAENEHPNTPSTRAGRARGATRTVAGYGRGASAASRPRVTSCAWRGSGRGGEAVAGAAHRLQASGTVAELAAQGADHDLDDVAAAAPLVAPYVAQERRPADNPAFAFVQVLQDVEFELGEIGASAVEDELAAAGIEHGVVVDEHFPRREVG